MFTQLDDPIKRTNISLYVSLYSSSVTVTHSAFASQLPRNNITVMMAYRSAMVATLSCLCVFACLTSVMALTDDQIALLKQLREMCMAETGVAEATIEACKTGNFADDPKLKCYIKCTYEQVAVIDDDGVIDGDAMIAMLPEELADIGPPIVKKCQTVTGSDACDVAFKFNKCIYEANPEKYMIA